MRKWNFSQDGDYVCAWRDGRKFFCTGRDGRGVYIVDLWNDEKCRQLESDDRFSVRGLKDKKGKLKRWLERGGPHVLPLTGIERHRVNELYDKLGLDTDYIAIDLDNLDLQVRKGNDGSEYAIQRRGAIRLLDGEMVIDEPEQYKKLFGMVTEEGLPYEE